ncbi:MAG TPA: glycoside hydrolase family 15 protein [Acidimicrobiales bacterium]|nr:glycoside hydrolase family 15 protein [Acidimicrobiales bacterium]
MRRSSGEGRGPLEPPAPAVLRQYAIVADGERGAVIGPTGDVTWLCFPRFDSPAIFASLISGHGGYSVAPCQPFVWGGQYEDRTLIWRSRWVTAGGLVSECRDALEFPGKASRVVLLRQLAAVTGPARLRVVLHPRSEYGARPFDSWHCDEVGTWSARSGAIRLRWSGAPNARPHRDGHRGWYLECELALEQGEHLDLVLELSEDEFEGPPPDPRASWKATEDNWRRDVPRLDVPVAARDAQHAAAVLRGLTASTGATVAAATMALPERADQGRSYDYRYAWLRDECFVGQALFAADLGDLGDQALAFVRDRVLADGPRLAPAYTQGGGQVPAERELGLPGYPGGNDIVGNHVRNQFQLDVFGEVLLLLAAAARAGRLDAEGWRAAETAVAAVAARWDEPDAGIWELDARWWTESRLACVAGLRAIAGAGAPASVVGDWLALAESLLAETARRCTHPGGRWQRAADDEQVDAALLFASIRGAVAPEDPRTQATVAAVHAELEEDGYVYRFRPDNRPLGEAEGAFLLCGFALSLAELQRGRVVESARWFERTRASCGPPGLFSEEFDIAERQLRGNLPQAFVHALFLESAVRQGSPTVAAASTPP